MEKSQHGGVVNLNEIKGIAVAETVELQVTGRVESGSIEKIEVIETEGIIFKEDDPRNSDESKIYVVSENGTYHFRITGSTGRTYILETTVTNAAPVKKDLITGIADINEAGYKMIKVNGRTKEVDPTIEEIDDPQLYTLDVIYCDGDLILKNGSYTKNASGSQVAKTVDGLTVSGTNWTVGKVADVNTNTVVLKVNGDFTLESTYNLLPVKSGTAYSKGLIIYCTGTATINGNVNMTNLTCTAGVQNIYLWKNNDGTFEYIRKNGGNAGGRGAAGTSSSYQYNVQLSNGTTQTVKDNHWITGGGGGGQGGNSGAAGAVGNCWRGGNSGGGSCPHGSVGGVLGGGVVVIYGNVINGSGNVSVNGMNGGAEGGSGSWYTNAGCGAGRWRWRNRNIVLLINRIIF